MDTMYADRAAFVNQTAQEEPKASSQDTLETVAKQVEARVVAGDRDQKRADDHLKSAGLLLIELKKRLKIEQPGVTWPKWSTIHLKGVGISRQYTLIAIAEGKTTAEAERAKNAKANQEHRARAKGNPSRDGKAEVDPARKAALKAISDFVKDLPTAELKDALKALHKWHAGE
jgi:hypothetical protein